MSKHTERLWRFKLAVVSGTMRVTIAIVEWLIRHGFATPPPIKDLGTVVTTARRQWIICPPEGRRNVVNIPADGKTRTIHIDSAGRPSVIKEWT